jgi:hypothetical protein
MIERNLSKLIEMHFGLSDLAPVIYVAPDTTPESRIHTTWNVQIPCTVRVDNQIRIDSLVLTGVISNTHYLGLPLATADTLIARPSSISQDPIIPIDLSPLKDKLLPKLQCLDIIHLPINHGFDAIIYSFKLNVLSFIGNSEIAVRGNEIGILPQLDALWFDVMELLDYLAEKQGDPIIQRVVQQYKAQE